MSNRTSARVSFENVSLLMGNDNIHREDVTEKNDETWEETNSMAAIPATSAMRRLSNEERRIQRLNSDFLSSIEEGDSELFEQCLRKGANINATCRSSKFTACHAAVFFNKCNMLRELLKKGAESSLSLPNGCTPLHIAAWKGCLTCLTTLIEHQPDSVSTSVTSTESCDDPLKSLSVWDSWDHHHKLQHSEVPFIADGSTALMIACRQLHTECVEYLLHHNSDTEAVDCYGRTALDAVVKTVETINNCVTRHEKFNDTPALYCSTETINEFDPSTTPRGQLQFDKISEFIIFLLVDHAATRHAFEPAAKDGNIDWRSTYLLHPAVIMENEKLLMFLLHRNVDLQICNSSRDTPLHLAVRGGSKRMLEAFLEMGRLEPMLEMKDGEGKTPLLIAAARSWNYGANLLLEAGATVTAITDQGENLLHLAAKTNNRTMIKELFTFPEMRQIMNYKNVNSQTPLMVAVSRGNLKCVHELLVSGVDHLLRGENSATIAHMAAEKGYEQILELILRRDSSLLSTKTEFNETPLHRAVVGGHVGCVRLLLRKGSPTRVRALGGHRKFLGSSSSVVQSITFSGTALHYAVINDRVDIAESLINHDSDLVHVTNDAAWYPLDTAVHFGRRQCIEYIMKHGGDLNHEIPYMNRNPKSILDVLCYIVHDPVAFLELVWDSCVTVDTKNRQFHDCSVSFDYSILRPISSQSNQMTVLRGMMKCEDEGVKRQLLAHPLTRTYLNLKWTKIGRSFFGLMLLMHVLMAFSMITFTMALNDWNATEKSMTTISIVVLIVTAILLGANQTFLTIKIYSSRKKDEKYWLLLSTYVIVLAISLCGLYFISNPASEFLAWRHFLPLPIILSWIDVLLVLRSSPSFGEHIFVFCRVLHNIIQVFVPLLYLFCGLILIHISLFTDPTPLSDLIPSMFEIRFWTSKSASPTSDMICNLAIKSITFVLITTLGIKAICTSVNDVTSSVTSNQSRVLGEQIEILYQAETYLCDRTLLGWMPKELRGWIEKKRNIPSTMVIPLEKLTDPSFKTYLPVLRRRASSLEKVDAQLKKTC